MALRSVTYQGHSYDIAYDIVGEGPTLVVLHGWGSNKEVMKSAFAKVPGFRYLFVDMPGFGKSPEPPHALTTQDYAAIIDLFLDALQAPKDIVMGHSFGGKVATLLSPKLLVLLSSAGIVEPKPLKVRLKIALFKALKPFGGASLRNLFVSRDAKDVSEVMYQTFKNVVDEDFRSSFAAYGGQALIFWGEEDRATSLASGQEIAKLIPKSKFFSLTGDHYFFLRHAPFIIQTIRQEYEKL